MKKELKDLFEYRRERELGKKLIFTNDLIENLEINGEYVNQFKNGCFIQYFPELSEIGNSSLQESFFLPCEVFEQLTFSLLRVFSFSLEKNFVNQRLSFFVLNDLLFNEECKKEEIFTYLLYCTSNSESIIEDCLLENGSFSYQGQQVDIVKYCDTYFRLLENNSDALKVEGFHGSQISYLNTVIQEILKGITSNTLVNSGYNSCFNFRSFFTLYKQDKSGFFKNLEYCLGYYKLSYWKDPTEYNISHYYGECEVQEIEILKRKVLNKEIDSQELDKKDKLYAEYVLDLYRLYYFEREDEQYLVKMNASQFAYFKHVLKYHSYRYIENRLKWIQNNI